MKLLAVFVYSDPSSINELVKKVEEIQEQVKNVIRLSEGVNVSDTVLFFESPPDDVMV